MEVVRLPTLDVRIHNAEAQLVWEAYRAGHPIRVPVILGTDTRFFLLENEDVNPGGRLSFREYSEDPIVMMDFQLRAAEWRANSVAHFCDDQAGTPERFTVTVDMQRYFDAGFFGAPVEYPPNQTPTTPPILSGGNKYRLFDEGLPDPLSGGIFSRAHRFYEAMAQRIRNGFTYQQRPVVIAPFGLETDGPLTVAMNLRGVELHTDMYDDPDYVHALLDFITEGTIARIKAHRRFFGLPEVSDAWNYADDAVEMISTEMLQEYVLPAHRKLKEALTTADRISIHLCGNAARHFRLLRDALGVYSFDTGYPVDLGQLREELGPEVELLGGPRVSLLLQATPDQVSAETKRILQSGVMAGGRFILREANDLAPGTPLENLRAMYDAARTYGLYA